MGQPVFLRIYKNDQLVEVRQFEGEQVILGQNGDVDISLADETVSPIHAMVELRESGYFLCDLGSTSGTFKNGEQVLDVSLESGDEIQIGAYRIEFYQGIPKPKSRPPRVGAPAVSAPQTPAPKAPPISFDVKPEKKSEKPAPASTTSTTSTRGSGLDVLKSVATFKPVSHSSAFKDVKNIVKPSKGTVVEILMVWKDRILSTYHLDQKKTVTVGSHPKNDIILPVFGGSRVSHPLVHLDSSAKIFITADMEGELVKGDKPDSINELIRKNRAVSSGSGYIIALEQGEMFRVDFQGGISIYIRYVSPAPKPLVAPFFHFSSAEFTTILGAIFLVGLLALYFAVYTPPEKTEEPKPEEPTRKAIFAYKPQIRPVEEVAPVESEPPKQAKLAEQKQAKQVKADKPAPKQAQPQPQKARAAKEDEGAASEAAPNKSKSQERKLTTPNAGKSTGIQKAQNNNSNKNDASGASQQKDVTKQGILSVFGSKGTQDQLAKVYSGAGVVGGAAKSATGSGSSSAVGAGDTVGEGLKDIGKGGSGVATVGIAGVKTKGRGGGLEGYGTGGIGDKKGATVIPGGAEESFDGTIDREAIRRVIIAHMREIKACYDRGLNRDPSLHGKVVVNWTIIARGNVGSARVASSTLDNGEVEKCIVSRFKTWNFPEPPAGQEAEVTYPFVFAAQN